MTNDYAALVAMLDQAAADLQAEIDAAIDRHGLLVRTADQLRRPSSGVITFTGNVTPEQQDAIRLQFGRGYVPGPGFGRPGCGERLSPIPPDPGLPEKTVKLPSTGKPEVHGGWGKRRKP